MHPYLPHLLSDIAEAHRENDGEEKLSQTLEEHIKEVEQFISGIAEQTFGYYCGLEAVDFPPSEQFSDSEIKEVFAAFEKLLHSWNAGIELPETLPLPLQYKFMVNTLDEAFYVVNHGTIHFDFCSGYAPDCAFKEYCPCLEYWKDL